MSLDFYNKQDMYVAAFNESRGHSIERTNYLDDLHNRKRCVFQSVVHCALHSQWLLAIDIGINVL